LWALFAVALVNASVPPDIPFPHAFGRLPVAWSLDFAVA